MTDGDVTDGDVTDGDVTDGDGGCASGGGETGRPAAQASAVLGPAVTVAWPTISSLIRASSIRPLVLVIYPTQSPPTGPTIYQGRLG